MWSFRRDDVVLASVDAIESLYLLQHELYRRLFDRRLVEYFTGPDEFRAAAAVTPDGVVHLPTWRLTWLPDQRFDLITCVQVLQEINETTLGFVLKQFRRLIRPGGLLYIRDNEFWMPAHRVRVGRELLRHGWHLAFRYPGNEGTDIEGVPRLWTYTGEDYGRYFKPHVRLKRCALPSYRMSFRSWRDIGLPI